MSFGPEEPNQILSTFCFCLSSSVCLLVPRGSREFERLFAQFSCGRLACLPGSWEWKGNNENLTAFHALSVCLFVVVCGLRWQMSKQTRTSRMVQRKVQADKLIRIYWMQKDSPIGKGERFPELRSLDSLLGFLPFWELIWGIPVELWRFFSVCFIWTFVSISDFVRILLPEFSCGFVIEFYFCLHFVLSFFWIFHSLTKLISGLNL